MKKKSKLCKLFLVLFLMNGMGMQAQHVSLDNGITRESVRQSPAYLSRKMQWFENARFGMFIHWGVYSTLGATWNGKKYGGYGAHIQRMAKIPIPEYREKVAGIFNPTHFNADEWVNLAKQAGMKYIVITSKHHDGFAMFDSHVSDYNVVKSTPYHKDPLMALKKACDKAGLKFCVYYSHAFDWGDSIAPGNDWEYNNPGGDKLINGAHWWENDAKLHFLDKAHKYVTKKSIPQLLELIHRYHPALIWFDTPHKLPASENLRIMQAVRRADPNVIINGRCVKGEGDYGSTTDRPLEFHPMGKYWEGIPTTNESYAYNGNDLSHKPFSHFIRLIVKAAARNGNILLNVGPKGDGTIDTPDVNILKGIGKWWKVNGEQSIRGTHQSPLDVQSWGESTMKGHTIYLHVMNWPTDGKLLVGGINRTATKAYLLCNRQKALPMKNMGENLEIQVPLVASDTVDAVIALQCNDLSKVTKHRLLAQNIASNEFRVFDATLSGHLKYGSEKKNFHWIEGWDSKDDMVSWNFSNVKAAKYQVSIDYEATEKDGDGGAYSVRIGDVSLKHDVRYGNRVMDDLGQIEIPAGDLKLEIRGENISGKELFRPRSIILTPIH
jgi:alpha-L-fucosidase